MQRKRDVVAELFTTHSRRPTTARVAAGVCSTQLSSTSCCETATAAIAPSRRLRRINLGLLVIRFRVHSAFCTC